ncbi:hypothetical protein [Kitasatospora sp. NPDC008115]|uniref:hypothetical protein n=1 Tax=Kitasatospora sp. NPDC008115 TaxID=3364022 RepID=UPI0036EA1171
MSFPFDAPVLEGAVVRLEPLGPGHRAGLEAAAEEERGTYGFTEVPRAEEWPERRARLERRIAQKAAARSSASLSEA